MIIPYKADFINKVAPLAGAWIEIAVDWLTKITLFNVAPLAGAWIEILSFLWEVCYSSVAPLAGAWIEIY